MSTLQRNKVHVSTLQRNNVLKTKCLVQGITHLLTVLPPDIDKLPHTEVERMFSESVLTYSS